MRGEKNHMFGKSHSAETRAKMSAAQRERSLLNKGNPNQTTLF